MNSKSENRYFLFIRKKKISFIAFDPVIGSILTKEIFIKDYSIDKIYYFLEHFLEKNIFEIERNLKNFIKQIYIIFESDKFFEAESSIKHNYKNSKFNYNEIKDTLIDIKNQFNKYSPGYEMIHMIINSYIIDGIVHKILPDDIDSENLVIQVNFICLEDQIIDNFKKIFSKYQISINKILSYEYLENLNNRKGENILKVANDNINGLNVNEVLIARKLLKNNGFFEKFFNFFN